MTITKKALVDVRVKSEDQGIVELVFSTFNKIDKDGDVTLKGAFAGNPPIAISAWAHSSWDGPNLPYGVGEIKESDTEATADVQFLMETTHGRDAFYTVKALSKAGIQEWSYSLENVDAERGTFENKSVRILKKVTVKEVSPLLRGAGTDTRTLAVKAHKTLDSQTRRQLTDAGRERFATDTTYVWLADFDPDEGVAIFDVMPETEAEYYVQVDYTSGSDGIALGENETPVESVVSYAPKAKFAEHATAVLAAVNELTTRARSVMAMRAEKGKAISADSREILAKTAEALHELEDSIATPATTDTTPADEDAELDIFTELELAEIERRNLQGATNG